MFEAEDFSYFLVLYPHILATIDTEEENVPVNSLVKLFFLGMI